MENINILIWHVYVYTCMYILLQFSLYNYIGAIEAYLHLHDYYVL